MQSERGTVASMLSSITSLEELNAFADMLRNPPEGCEVKRATEADWRRIAEMKIEFQRAAK